MTADEKVCPFCAETVKAAAIVCKHCGRDLQRQFKPIFPATDSPPERKTKWWLWGPLSVIGVLFVIGALTGPKDTVELANQVAERCIRNNGDGEWRGSMGVSLETFCRTKGNLEGIRVACQKNPARC